MRASLLLAQNIRSLLMTRGMAAKDLSDWVGHKPAWISNVLSAKRGIQSDDLDKIADFFGVSVSDLFLHGISPVLERRKRERRELVGDRRQGERRVYQPGKNLRLPALMPQWSKSQNHKTK